MASPFSAFAAREHVLRPHGTSHAESLFAESKAMQALKDMGSISPWKGVVGWPLPGNTAIATALAPLISGQVDLFAQAVKAQANGTVGQFGVGQAPFNNFLDNSQHPLKKVAPHRGGIHWGTWGSVGDSLDIVSAFIEHSVIQFQTNQNTDAYQPAMFFPPGARIRRNISQTQANAYMASEVLESDSDMQYEFPDTFRYTPDKTYGCLWKGDTLLTTWLATLTTQLTPPQGTTILVLLSGAQQTDVRPGA